MKKLKPLHTILFVALSGLLTFLSLNRHSRSGQFNYHSEIWADKAGYYVYLPAAFNYHFDPAQFPDSIEAKTGFGFKLNRETNKIQTKYTCGVALLQLPFYVLANCGAEFFGYAANGFSPIYFTFINLAAVFYLMMGLWWLFQFLKQRYNNTAVYLVLATVVFGSNLYYYAIDETGMSHVYSFALFAAFLYLLQKTNFLSQAKFYQVIGLGVVAGLIVLIRPINLIFLSCYFFMDTRSWKAIYLRLMLVLKPHILLSLLVFAALVFIPQLAYWHYSSGSLLTYSYGNESFNWLKPQIIATWFSPYNGLLSYSPFYFLLFPATFYLIKHNQTNGWFILILFIFLSYVLSCWWDRGFGCSFGARSYVEYLALFSIPVTAFTHSVLPTQKPKRIALWVFLIFCIGFNLKMTYSYDGCFYGGKNWDWESYFQLVVSATK